MLRRRSSTIPFGFKLSEGDSAYLEEIPEQLEVLEEIKPLIKDRSISLREGSNWILYKTGRSLSHMGLKKIVDNE
tara:strand:- start:1061 stop:1285 length:225 start_codon:yes stop_codon:yes gene_type:complete